MTTRRLAMTCWLVGVFSCTWGSASFTSLIRRHNFVGIHIFHSGKPRRNFLIQISSKIYLTLKEKGSEARKVCMIRYFSFPRWKATKRRRSSSSVQFFMILVSSGRRHDLLRVRYYMIILSALRPHSKQNSLFGFTEVQRRKRWCSAAGPFLCLWLKADGLLKWVRAKIWFTSLTFHSGLSLSHFLPGLKMWQ